MSDVPRRNNTDTMWNVEKDLQEVMYQVESMGANDLLTTIIDLLTTAKNLLGDYIDEEDGDKTST